MESAAISGARWVVGKALSPLSDGLVEAWAASSELSPNIEALKMELLYAQAMLNNARGREIHNPALAELLQRLRGLAYGAEDVLDELDYFRIQDELEDTFETVDRGCVHNLIRDARHTAKAAAKKLECTSCFPAAGGASEDDASCECVRQLASHARSTAQVIGKSFLCSSLLSSVRNGQDDDHSSTSRSSGVCTVRNGQNDDHSSTSRSSGVCTWTCMGMAPRKKRAPRTPKLGFDRVEISRRMKFIVEQLQPVCAKVSTILDLELLGSAIAKLELLASSGSVGHNTSQSRSITTSESTDPNLYGRDPEKDTIVQDITKGAYSGENLTVLPIVGPGGIGKTTLTQHIYNSQQVQEHFQIRVWVCVSLDFSVYRLTQEIAKIIPEAEDEKNTKAYDELQNLDQLQKLVEKRLKNTRFLLVLDDIWKSGNEEDWNQFLVPFKKGQAKGNIVLVTTRFLEVANMVKTTDKSLQLEGLQPEEYWTLFVACVFGHGEAEHSQDSELNRIGKQIVEKLKGSPLAAKTVGKLLRNNLTQSHWTRVLESKEWESQTSDHDIMPALKLSYDYLPFHLQQCFFYCALFPKDYNFYSEELIRFWIGLDIICPSHKTKRIEDIGLDYLNELVSYGFFKTETSERGTCYVIHDLLHDLALKVSSQECLYIDSSSPRPVEISPSIYHLSINMSLANSRDGTIGENFVKELGKIRNRLKSQNLRTLMLFGEFDAIFVRPLGDLFKDAKSVRVVYLPIMESILPNFSKLVHLRYLSLGPECSSSILFVSRFYHLRVLQIEKWVDDNFATDMSNLINLRHFGVPFDADECHSNISSVGKLKFLQELRQFRVKKENNGFELRELGQLAELGGSLSIGNLENVQANEAHKAKLLYKNRLHKLILSWKEDRSNKNADREDKVLESLRPHSNLHELSINWHGGLTCPTWLAQNLCIKGLETLHLEGVAWKVFPPLGELWLIGESGEENIGCIAGPKFQNLKRLELVGLQKLRRWVANIVCPTFFSLIEVLIVKDCCELTELPFSYYTCKSWEGDGKATWFPKLRETQIKNCPNLLSLPLIPYTHTLCDVDIECVRTGLVCLLYSYKSFYLRIVGNRFLHSLDDTVLVFHNLTHLQYLTASECPPLAEEHLQMLTSLKTLQIIGSSNVFMPLARCDVKWQIPVENLYIHRCGASGKEVTHLLSHLPKLSELYIMNCEKITHLGVEVEQKPPILLSSSPAVKIVEDTQATDENQQIAGEIEEEELVLELVAEQEKGQDGLLLFPDHLSKSLQLLDINTCPELSLVPPSKDDRREGGRGGDGGGIQALFSLQKLYITSCPKLCSSFPSSACPFPSSLKNLTLSGRIEGMETLEPLSNLTSLTHLACWKHSEHLRCKGLSSLLTRGQLSNLRVFDIPKFFASWDPVRELQEHMLTLSPSSKLLEIYTDDAAGVLAAPIRNFISSSLTKLGWFWGGEEVERFTKPQEEALQQLTSLEELHFMSFPKLQRLPAGLNKLTNLKILRIYECEAIRSLPKHGLPNSLQELDVEWCGNEELKRRCRRLTRTIPKTRL